MRSLPAEMFPLPRKRTFKSPEEIQKECRILEEKHKGVQNLLFVCRQMAAGTSFEHPGFLARNPRCSPEVRRLLVSLGVLYIQASLLEERPDLKPYVMGEAAKELRRWEEGNAEEDLLEEWEEAYNRCRGCVQAQILGHWPDREVPFTKENVKTAMKDTKGWVGDINYSHIKKQLLREVS